MDCDGLWRLERGATVTDDSVRFAVWAPRVEKVSVRIEHEGGVAEHALSRGENGTFAGTIRGVGAGTDYRYRLDGTRDRPDPVSRHQPQGVHGPSRVVDPARFVWSDADWVGIEAADLVIYELHVGTFTAAGSFDGVIDRLAELCGFGVTAIELMPVAEFPGARNWGYDGVHPFAPHGRYGGPDGLKRLVDAAHRAGLSVLLDVVYNHLGPAGNYLEEFGPYFTDRYRTPWGKAMNFDGPDSDEVRRYSINNALYWTSEFHLDGLRLDAVHAIYDFGARHILEEIADRVHAQASRLERRALIIAESDLNDPRVLRPRERGGYGLDAQWSDDFHHAVHAALTGERRGYYVDFGGAAPVARALSERFVMAGGYSTYRRRRHGADACDVSADHFVVFVQNHDQVGNRPLGERLSTLVSLPAQKLAAALLLLSPYVPLLFMGEEYGETRPFLYFVSHEDADLVEAVRQGRKQEFASFGWSGELPDPQAQDTFLRSRIDWGARDRAPHQHLLRLYQDLLRLRSTEPVLRPGDASVEVRAPDDAGGNPGGDWIEVRYRRTGSRELLALFNLRPTSLESVLPASPTGSWRLRLSTEDARYGGGGSAAQVLPADASEATRRLAAYEGLLYDDGGAV
jgi:maltooligosyltrehalose trehalohydrolase